jgi:hypothetical protein
MKLKAMTFQSEEGDAAPNRVTVEMSLEEALAIALVFGHLNDLALRKLDLGDAEGLHGIYDCLVGDVFNRYWEDGTNDLKRIDSMYFNVLNERQQAE